MSNGGLHWLDWCVIGLYAVFMIGVGWYCSRKQTSSEEYFLASRNMGSFIVGISTFATLLSTISYLASPGEIIKHGPIVLCGFLAAPVMFLVVGYALIPSIMRLKITSAYELLETRLGIQIRILGSVIFILTRLVWMALLIFLASKAMVAMLGWPQDRVPYVVMVAGLIAVAYTVIGGLRAVIITDVFQFFILMGGALLTIMFISIKMGGVSTWWPTSWASNWDHQPFFSLNPNVRATLVGSMLAYFCWWVCTAGSDQVVIQRYLATRDVRSARRSFLVNTCADIAVGVILGIVGFAILGFFRENPQCLPAGQNVITEADYLFPHYIANYLPIGISGIVVAGMFAAAMSSLDSGINSIVTVFNRDFLVRFRKHKHTEQSQLKVAKYLVLGIGVVVVLMSSLIGKVPGNIIEVTNKTNGLFVAPLFGLFFMALFIPFSNAFGAFFGAIYGFLTAFIIAYWDLILGRQGLSFQWIIPAALAINIVVGILFSLLYSRCKNRAAKTACYLLSILPIVVGLVILLQYQNG